MHYYKQAKLNAEAQENETVFIIRVIGICDDARIVVEKSGFRLRKGNTMLPQVFRRLPSVPFEGNLRHNYIVATLSARSMAPCQKDRRVTGFGKRS